MKEKEVLGGFSALLDGLMPNDPSRGMKGVEVSGNEKDDDDDTSPFDLGDDDDNNDDDDQTDDQHANDDNDDEGNGDDNGSGDRVMTSPDGFNEATADRRG